MAAGVEKHDGGVPFLHGTTHLTGVVTDLGIEAARWFRFVRHHIGERSNLKLTLSSTPAERPHYPKVALLLTIFAWFVIGALVGALLVVRLHHLALLAPVVGLIALGLFALATAGEIVHDHDRR